MNFRTFYNRVEQKVKSPKQKPVGSDKVQPNLTLSIRDIFDRWSRNEPLDIMTRNGSFMIEGDDEENFEGYDIDSKDPAEVYQDSEMLASKLAGSSKLQSKQGQERSEMADADDVASEPANEDVSE